MYDFHTHSKYSDDGSFELRSMAESALKKRLDGICFTDHIDIGYPDPEAKYEFPYEEYNREVLELKDKYSGRLEIYKGIELGLQPHLIRENHEYLKDKEFDFIIGSLHCAGNTCVSARG
jgi:histidinol-phosphatase (PHP family)